MAEMKALESIHGDLTKKGALIIGVAHGADEADVLGVREKQKVNYPPPFSWGEARSLQVNSPAVTPPSS